MNNKYDGQGTLTIKWFYGAISTFIGEFKNGEYFNGIYYMNSSEGIKTIQQHL